MSGTFFINEFSADGQRQRTKMFICALVHSDVPIGMLARNKLNARLHKAEPCSFCTAVLAPTERRFAIVREKSLFVMKIAANHSSIDEYFCVEICDSILNSNRYSKFYLRSLKPRKKYAENAKSACMP